MGVKWYLNVLICISLRVILSIFSCAYWPFVYFWRNAYASPKYCPHFKKICLFLVVLGLCVAWVFLQPVVVHELLTVMVSLVVEHGLQGAWVSVVVVHRLQSTGSIVAVHGLNCSVAHGILLDQESNLCLQHFTTEHQVRPLCLLSVFFFFVLGCRGRLYILYNLLLYYIYTYI